MVAGVDAVAAAMEGRFGAAIEKMPRADKLMGADPDSQFELTMTRFFYIMTLALHGDVRELAERVAEWRRDAVERGDLYTLANLSNGFAALAGLVDGDSAAARAQASDAIAIWSQRGFFTQHYYGLMAQVNFDLYEGRGESALERVAVLWPGMRSSLLTGVQFIRIAALDLRARAALAAAPTAAVPGVVRALAAASATLLDEEHAPWASAMAALIRAQLVADKDALLRAADVCERAALGGYAALARRRAGADEEWTSAEELRDPDSWMRMLVPGGAS